MLILAMEQSTARGGIALLEGGVLLGAAHWQEERKREQRVFHEVRALLSAANRDLATVERFAVGLGPGSFSGIRIAIAACCAMALPDKVPLAGISSAEALAVEAARLDPEARHIAVIGDARRQRVWVAVWTRTPGLDRLEPMHPLALAQPDALDALLPAACRIVSPDQARLGACLAALGPARAPLPAVTAPNAGIIAQLAARDSAPTTTPLAPPTPLYLHPAAFPKPI